MARVRGRGIAIRLLEFLNRRRARRAGPPDIATIKILLLHAYGMGGTIRTVFTLAGHLARDHDVEIISVVRENERPFFPVPPGVRVSFLDDRLRSRRGLLDRLPSRLIPGDEKAYHRFSLRTDLLLVRRLRALRPGVLITTRPGLNLLAARFAPPGVITIGQEHVQYRSHSAGLQRLIRRRYGRLDALVTLTERDLRDYRKALPRFGGVLTRIPNAVPPLGGGTSSLTEPTVVAVGRLVRVKGYDLLLRAWRQVVAAHPGWTLRIYGAGPQEEPLRELIAELGLTGHAFLMGPAQDVGPELAKASICAVTSRHEGFALTLLEAMSKGLAVVSVDCPHGPREVITHGHDGLLVRPRKAAAMAAALRRLIEDEELRRTLGGNARRTARAYAPDLIGAEWDALLAELARRAGDPSSAGERHR